MSVEVEVRSQLLKIVADLEKIQRANQELSGSLKNTAKNVGEGVKTQTKTVNQMLEGMGRFGRRVADQLRQDFMSLGSIASLTAGLKLSEQFGGSIKEAVGLSDTVRRLGSVFGIARKDFGSFQSLLQTGLGEIGASSEAAANALKGLAETPVRGQANLLAYARTAAELASISGEKGQEGTIAKGAAGVITARGGNVNDQKELSAVSREILQIRQATGKSVTEVTSALGEIYSKTNKDFQKNLKGGGSTSLASAALMGGPQATSFIEKYLGMNRIERKGLEAQGFGNILQKNGEINTKAILGTLQEAKGRGLGDAQAGLKTYGFGDDEAKGFIRLAEALQRGGEAINGAHNAQVDLNEEYRKSMSLGDSFRANINRVKSFFSPLISGASQGMTDVLGRASQSTGGAVGVTAGAGVLAAVLAGGGLKGLGKGLFGGLADEAKAKAYEAATGEHVARVEVINWPASMGAGGALKSVLSTGGFFEKTEALAGGATAVGGGTAAAGGLGAAATLTAGTVAAGAGALAVGAAAGYGLEKLYEKGVEKNVGGLGDLDKKIQAVFDIMYQKLFGYQIVQPKVRVELKKEELKHASLPGRGSS